MKATIKIGALCAGLRATLPRSPGSKPGVAKPERTVVGHLEAYLAPFTDTGYLTHRDTGERVLCTMLRECGRGC